VSDLGVRVVMVRPGEVELEVAAYHPDAPNLPLPGHRPAWACVLLGALGYAPEQMSLELIWKVADGLTAIRLLEVRDYPRTDSNANPTASAPTMRVCVRFPATRELFAFAAELELPPPVSREYAISQAAVAMASREGWRAGLTLEDFRGDGPKLAGTEQWSRERVDALAFDAQVPDPHDRLATLVRAGREQKWGVGASWTKAVMTYRGVHDVVPLLLDNPHASGSLAEAATLRDPRVDDAIAIAVGDPNLVNIAAVQVGLAGRDATPHVRAVLARAIEAFDDEATVFRRRAYRSSLPGTGTLLAWAGMRALDDNTCVRTLAASSTRAIKAAQRLALRWVPADREAEFLAMWPTGEPPNQRARSATKLKPTQAVKQRARSATKLKPKQAVKQRAKPATKPKQAANKLKPKQSKPKRSARGQQARSTRR